jgi:dipeptidase E
MTRTIVALGGGGFSQEQDPRLDAWIVSLAASARPKVCFVPTGSGDSEAYLVAFYAAFAALDCRLSQLGLFRRRVADIEQLLLTQDIVYVGGGNTANLLAVWRAHGVDRALRRAWESGVLLCGVSAGALCWFESGVTDSFGSSLAPIFDGLGFVAGSFCPHYDGEPLRRPRYTELIGDGRLPAGYAADDGVALRFSEAGLSEVVASREQARAWSVSKRSDGGVEQRELPTRCLPAYVPNDG